MTLERLKRSFLSLILIYTLLVKEYPNSGHIFSFHFFFVFSVLLQINTKLTAAQKSLSKVDKKGMKSISSFFGAAAGSKKTKKR